MLTAKTGQKGSTFIVLLTGAIDDAANLEQAIGPVPQGAELMVNCAGVNRINSVGVKGWIKYFQQMKPKVGKITYMDCSPPIVQQMNLVFNFTCGGYVASFQASFACEKCQNVFLQTLQTSAIVQGGMDIPDQKCPKCGGNGTFDDIPKMYLKFLTNRA